LWPFIITLRYVYAGVRGFASLCNDALRYRYIITEKALKKARILAFWEKHGLDAAMETFSAKRRPLKDFEAGHPGHCVALDTIEKIIDGKRRYVITFEDLFTRFGFALETTSHASLAAKEFFEICVKVFPFSFAFMFVLTDNGSEFKKHFTEELKNLHLVHYHTYPKTPKMNTQLERFNRTLQDEFIDYHMSDLLEPETFNRKLAECLI
jgi:transposase InsO family protein